MVDANKTVVVTGAHAPLGSGVVRHLLERTACRVTAVVTPWGARMPSSAAPARLHVVALDLTRPFDGETTELFAGADRVLHFAWARDREAERAEEMNRRMVESITEALGGPARLAFISSVGASAHTPSIYGRTKWRIAERVRTMGGCVLVCGLVIADPPQGPYKMLADMVARVPVSLRFFAGPVPVYPTPVAVINRVAQAFVEENVPPGTYRLFPAHPVDLNRTLASLEARAPRRRVPVPVPTAASVAAVRALGSAHLMPFALADKILTFLHKDRCYLEALPTMPGVESSLLEGPDVA